MTLTGNLPAAPSQTYVVEFFASRAPSPSGYGEGQWYLGSVRVTTDATGNAPFTARLPVRGIGWDAGHAYFTATATSTATGSTSEFSQALPLTPQPDRSG